MVTNEKKCTDLQINISSKPIKVGLIIEQSPKLTYRRFLTGRAIKVKIGWLVGFAVNGPLRQYFSLYRAASQREGERGKKG